MEFFLPLSLAATLYLLVLWIALTTPPRPPQLSDPTLRDEWDSVAFRVRKGVERLRRR
ncbi:MAG: hypothetical protein ACTH4Y_14460 [Microbacterium gubbeenense]|uniref:Uncharacterized protein n=2 Tax=Microbacteriaceae TaxID=85023 RepID=A0A1R4F3H1_9MICO|nr:MULTISPECIES: hypothetical protein [Microbacteriaceae]SJM50478.1 hypothetical protein CZ674_02365 [Agrococcus casei LMG 22410]SJM59751.1 hypothetical protein CZ774_09505 [Frigoribacterium sp. JB110]SJN47190.1 hypothetical protein FM104_15795 [Microbacterium esteraromaticum]